MCDVRVVAEITVDRGSGGLRVGGRVGGKGRAVIALPALGWLVAACGGGGHPGAGVDAAGVDAGAIPTTIVALDHAGIGSEGSTGWPNISHARADVDWNQGPFAKVLLVVEVETACFPFDKWAADPPPTGQNWPADCDAFDCNFNVYIDDAPGDGGGQPPPFEVIHAITPFGGPEHLEVDLTDLANALPGKHGIRVDLGELSRPRGAGHGLERRVDGERADRSDAGDPPRHVLAAVPLYVGAIGAGDPFPVVSWTVPEGAIGGRLEYRTSGHGQGATGPRCIGPAEEFCDRTHQIFIDGAQVDNIDTFREDCESLCTLAHQGPADGGFDYCTQNPCGNVNSAKASRANWCPGTMTPPFVWDGLPALATPGMHTFSFQIQSIISGGIWMGSAFYIAYGA